MDVGNMEWSFLKLPHTPNLVTMHLSDSKKRKSGQKHVSTQKYTFVITKRLCRSLNYRGKISILQVCVPAAYSLTAISNDVTIKIRVIPDRTFIGSYLQSKPFWSSSFLMKLDKTALRREHLFLMKNHHFSSIFDQNRQSSCVYIVAVSPVRKIFSHFKKVSDV